jgi:dTDP-4-amino-4,6-dideoxygalactose transaminase
MGNTTDFRARARTRARARYETMESTMSEEHFLPYAKQHISKEDLEAVQSALSQPIITRGPLVEAFEKEFTDFCGAKYAVAFNNASAALAAAYHAANVGPNDRVITTPNSFVASISPAIEHSARPIFVDIDRNTGNLNLEHALLNINQLQSKGKAIAVPVHFSGIPVDIQALDAQIANHQTIIIEDAAHALGSCYKDGTKVGACTWSHMTVFSFHPAKTITTGEGGIVTTNDPHLYHQLKCARGNGIERDPHHLSQQPYPGYYEVKFLSGNYNFTEMQAALGLSQLKQLPQFVEKRQQLMELYRHKLSSIEHVRLFSVPANVTIGYHLCVVQIDFAACKTTRKAVMEELYSLGIGTQVHYIPLYRHPFFMRVAGDISEYFPEMEGYYAEALSLPLYYDLSEEDVDRVVSSLKKVLRK